MKGDFGIDENGKPINTRSLAYVPLDEVLLKIEETAKKSKSTGLKRDETKESGMIRFRIWGDDPEARKLWEKDPDFYDAVVAQKDKNHWEPNPTLGILRDTNPELYAEIQILIERKSMEKFSGGCLLAGAIVLVTLLGILGTGIDVMTIFLALLALFLFSLSLFCWPRAEPWIKKNLPDSTYILGGLLLIILAVCLFMPNQLGIFAWMLLIVVIYGRKKKASPKKSGGRTLGRIKPRPKNKEIADISLNTPKTAKKKIPKAAPKRRKEQPKTEESHLYGGPIIKVPSDPEPPKKS